MSIRSSMAEICLLRELDKSFSSVGKIAFVIWRNMLLIIMDLRTLRLPRAAERFVRNRDHVMFYVLCGTGMWRRSCIPNSSAPKCRIFVLLFPTCF